MAYDISLYFLRDSTKSMVSLCQLGVGLMVGSIFVCMFKGEPQKKFLATLSIDQQKAFSQIVSERFFIYVAALFIGSAIGYASLQTRCGLGDNMRICFAVGVTFISAYIIYQVWPKSRYTLQFLTSQTQTLAWLNYYKSMKNLYHVGFFVGIIGFGVFSLGFVQSNKPITTGGDFS